MLHLTPRHTVECCRRVRCFPYFLTYSIRVRLCSEKCIFHFPNSTPKGERMEQNVQYIIVSLIPQPFEHRLERLMDEIGSIIHMTPLYQKFPPHITLHPPLTGISEIALRNALGQTISYAKEATITLDGRPFPFGKKYIVLPVYPTLGVASLWADLTRDLSCLHGYKRLVRTTDRTLHVTLAKKISNKFNRTWPRIKKVETEPMTFKLENIVLYRQINGDPWESIRTFNVPQ